MSHYSELADELIQVAAVAVAIVENLETGIASAGGWNMMHHPVLREVYAERIAQDQKWGPQHHSPMEWLAILGEEYGEACKAALETHKWPERQQQVYDKDAS